jgi:hypothetical protein
MKKQLKNLLNCGNYDMGKDPAFLFYPGDWDGGTKLFTRAEKGAYMDLLIAQFNCGHMTIQEVGHMLGQDFDSMWESKLKKKFAVDADGKFYNVKLENEQIRRKSFTESRKQNFCGINQHSHMGAHTTSRMETETVHITKDKDRVFDFEKIWNRYPKKDGKKQAEKFFRSSVKTEEDWLNINKALDNYLKTENVVKGNLQYVKNGSTWFNNWEDWINMQNRVKPEPESAISLLTKAIL